MAAGCGLEGFPETARILTIVGADARSPDEADVPVTMPHYFVYIALSAWAVTTIAMLTHLVRRAPQPTA